MSSPATALTYRAQMFITLDSNGQPKVFQIVHYPTAITKAQLRLAARMNQTNKIITMQYTRDSNGNLHDIDVTSNQPLPSDADLTKMITGHYVEQSKQTPFFSVAQRPPYYDRNPKPIFFSALNTAVTPATQRWSYTVPPNRKAIIEAVLIGVIRTSAAALVGEAYATIDYQPAGTSIAYNLFLGEIFTNNLGDKDIYQVTSGTVLLAGDTILALDGDASTGGNVYATEICKLTEFDA